MPVTLTSCFATLVQSPTACRTLYVLTLPTFYLLLVVTSHLILEVFARQLLLFGTVSPLTFILLNLHNISPTPEISSFPLSLCQCLATLLSASDSFSTMALHKFTYLLRCDSPGNSPGAAAPSHDSSQGSSSPLPSVTVRAAIGLEDQLLVHEEVHLPSSPSLQMVFK